MHMKRKGRTANMLCLSSALRNMEILHVNESLAQIREIMRAIRRKHSRDEAKTVAPYSGNSTPEPPNPVGKSLSFRRPSRMGSFASP